MNNPMINPNVPTIISLVGTDCKSCSMSFATFALCLPRNGVALKNIIPKIIAQTMAKPNLSVVVNAKSGKTEPNSNKNSDKRETP